jgi:hypothetical protein
MHKTASRKIGIFLIGLIFLAGTAILTPSLCGASMHELPDGDLAAVYAYGFSTFTLDGNTVKLDFSGVTLSTWTEIGEMALGNYSRGSYTLPWDNDWTGPVSLGSASINGSKDLTAAGLYIEAGFSNITDPANRQLEYVRIGTKSLTGTISANFVSFSGTIGATDGVPATGTTYTRSPLGAQIITSVGGGFYMALDRIGSSNQLGYSFYFGSGSHL